MLLLGDVTESDCTQYVQGKTEPANGSACKPPYPQTEHARPPGRAGSSSTHTLHALLDACGKVLLCDGGSLSQGFPTPNSTAIECHYIPGPKKVGQEC